MSKAPIRSEYLALPWVAGQEPSYPERVEDSEKSWDKIKKSISEGFTEAKNQVMDYYKNLFQGGPSEEIKATTEGHNAAILDGLANMSDYLGRIESEPFGDQDNFIDTSLKGAYWAGRSPWETLKWLMSGDETKENPALEAYKKELAGGSRGGGLGAGTGTGTGIKIPGISAINLPSVDYSALRQKIQDLDIDTEQEVARHNWLTSFGEALANIDLTSNLAGDWSKAAKIMADFDKERNHDEAATRNKSKQQKAELEMWKAMKDVALQEAEQNQALRQAELSLRNQQLQMQAAMQQAKANAFYSGAYGPGGWTGGDKTKEARVVGGNASLIDIMEKPKMTMQQAAKKAKRDAMTLPQKDQVPYILGYMQQYAAAKGALNVEGD